MGSYTIRNIWAPNHVKIRLDRSSVFYSETHACNVGGEGCESEVYMYILEIRRRQNDRKVDLDGFVYGNKVEWTHLNNNSRSPWNKSNHKEWVRIKNIEFYESWHDDKFEIYKSDEDHPLGTEILNSLNAILEGREFYKYGNDCHVTFGDGGDCCICMPLYAISKLRISSKSNQNLILALHKIAEKSNDIQTDAPVQELIDPELHPVFYDDINSENKVNWVEARISHINYEMIRCGQHTGYLEYWKYRETVRQLSRVPSEQKIEKANDIFAQDPLCLRYMYHWKPCELSVNRIEGENSLSHEHIIFKSPIPSLPVVEENREVYKGLAKVFNAMLPAFKKLGIYGKEPNDVTTLQVIVKAQIYSIPPHSTYTGKWHVEGITEKILAVGTYYPFVDDEFTGGNLIFRPVGAPYPSYFDDRVYQEEVLIGSGSAVVFSNSLCHRFNTIKNNTDRTLERLFVNFFVVDPATRLPDGPSVDGVWGLDKRKENRTAMRKILQDDKAGWGYIFHGNVGVLEYVREIAAGEYQYGLRDDLDDDS